MNSKMVLIAVCLAALMPRFGISQESVKRPAWYQKTAVEKVKGVIAMEEHGQPWDKIAWLTDIDEAVARSQKENKPLFVYFFLKKDVGPSAAPC